MTNNLNNLKKLKRLDSVVGFLILVVLLHIPAALYGIFPYSGRIMLADILVVFFLASVKKDIFAMIKKLEVN
jgi:hypothetical protein